VDPLTMQTRIDSSNAKLMDGRLMPDA